MYWYHILAHVCNVSLSDSRLIFGRLLGFGYFFSLLLLLYLYIHSISHLHIIFFSDTEYSRIPFTKHIYIYVCLCCNHHHHTLTHIYIQININTYRVERENWTQKLGFEQRICNVRRKLLFYIHQIDLIFRFFFSLRFAFFFSLYVINVNWWENWRGNFGLVGWIRRRCGLVFVFVDTYWLY